MAETITNDFGLLKILQPTETVKCTLQTYTSADPNPIRSWGDDFGRMLVIIVHRDRHTGVEVGGILTLKSSSNGESAIQRAFPITSGFSISVSQINNPQSSGPKADNGFRLTIGSPGTTEMLYSFDVEQLQLFLKEFKLLQDLFDSIQLTSTSHFSWLNHYKIHKDIFPPSLSGAPIDLRLVKKPLQTLLSDASAGSPGNDDADVTTIREDWVRKRAWKKCVENATSHAKAKLNIRVGTFNVNGKFPSQDLTTWVRAKPQMPGTIAPLNTLSPLSLGELTEYLVKNKDAQNAIPAEEYPFPDIESSVSATTAVTNATVMTSTSTSIPDSTLVPAKAPTSLLQPFDPSSDEPDPDLIVLGFQELDLSTEALIYSTSTTKENTWCAAVIASLGEKGELYQKLASRQLVGILLVVFVKKSLTPNFDGVKTCSAGIGILGMMGNKGAIGIRLQYRPTPSSVPTTLTFVNAHLAAFDEMVDRRNQDFHDLSRRLTFESLMGGTNVYESDALFWMGDLNYRLDVPDEDVRAILASKTWVNQYDALLEYDQLRNAAKLDKAFQDFQESPITHSPTYRFSAGMPTDSLGYDLKRKPAWTDRILHLSNSTTRIRQSKYVGHPEITMSDHRPVSATFSVEVDILEKKLFEEIIHRQYSKVAHLNSPSKKPDIRLDTTNVDLGKVSYKRNSVRKVELKNAGEVPAAFRFLPQDFGSSTCPSWMRVEPQTGLLLPGETLSVVISTVVDRASTSQLNFGPRKLELSLIIHVAFGRDYFIYVTADYEYSCFGNSISRLIRLPGCISSLKDHTELLPESRANNAPREVMRLVHWLMSKTPVERLFSAKANVVTVAAIRQCLDTGADFDFPNEVETILAFGEALVELLQSLTEPVIPPSYHAKCLEANNRGEAFESLDELPAASINVWISITAFLNFLSQIETDNEVERDKAERFASIFAPILLADDPRGVYSPASPLRKRNFLLFFLG